MHYDTTLPQALDAFDTLTAEYRQLRQDIADTERDAGQATRLQSLALDALETEISSTIGSVKYRRSQERDKRERQAELDATEARERQAADATRERLQRLTAEEHTPIDDPTSASLRP